MLVWLTEIFFCYPGLGAVPNNSNQAALLGLNGGFSTSYSPLQQQQQTMFPIRPPGIAGATGYPQLYPSLQQQPPPVNPLLANNPFMEPTAAAAPQLSKMISTLPQNVFQVRYTVAPFPYLLIVHKNHAKN